MPECGKLIAESLGIGRVARPGSIPTINPPDSFRRQCRCCFGQPIFSKRWRCAVRWNRHADCKVALGDHRRSFRHHRRNHCVWYWSLNGMRGSPRVAIFSLMFVVLAVVSYFCLDAITRLASWLTNWEATYRGIRLPYDIVLRGMYYHAPITCRPLGRRSPLSAIKSCSPPAVELASTATYTGYLYVLSALVVVSAGYLFNTYWIGMRNMMYANR